MNTLICMAFDGDYVTEGRDFQSVDAAWERSNDMGSRWFFYPFHFVMTESGKTVVDAPEPLQHLIGYRIGHLVEHFKETSQQPELQNVDAEIYAYSL
jgi:hypothetical protein